MLLQLYENNLYEKRYFDPIPATDIEQILVEKKWKESDLKKDQREVLKKALGFLKLVSEGYRIVSETAKTQKIDANIQAIEAYLFACNNITIESKQTISAFDLEIKEAEKVISSVLSDEIVDRKNINDIDLNKAHLLFLQLSKAPSHTP